MDYLMAFFVRVSPRSGKGLNPKAPLLGMDTAEKPANETESPIHERNPCGNQEKNTEESEMARGFASSRGGVEERGDVGENIAHVVEHTRNGTADSLENIINHSLLTSFNPKLEIKGRKPNPPKSAFCAETAFLHKAHKQATAPACGLWVSTPLRCVFAGQARPLGVDPFTHGC